MAHPSLHNLEHLTNACWDSDVHARPSVSEHSVHFTEMPLNRLSFTFLRPGAGGRETGAPTGNGAVGMEWGCRLGQPVAASGRQQWQEHCSEFRKRLVLYWVSSLGQYQAPLGENSSYFHFHPERKKDNLLVFFFFLQNLLGLMGNW